MVPRKSTTVSSFKSRTVNEWISQMPLKRTSASREVLVGKFKPSTNNQSYELDFHNNNNGTYKFEAGISSNGSSASFNGVNISISTGTWYYVTAVYTASAGTVQFFVDGS